MRQLLYISSKAPGAEISVGSILTVSRRNNIAAGVSGLLYTDGTRFLQVLEGQNDAVERTFERIKADPRHRAVVVLSDTQQQDRQFGHWSMAHRGAGDAADAFDDRLSAMLADASPTVRSTFLGLVAVRRAA